VPAPASAPGTGPSAPVTTPADDALPMETETPTTVATQ
jgi:hypothetical protein